MSTDMEDRRHHAGKRDANTRPIHTDADDTCSSSGSRSLKRTRMIDMDDNTVPHDEKHPTQQTYPTSTSMLRVSIDGFPPRSKCTHWVLIKEPRPTDGPCVLRFQRHHMVVDSATPSSWIFKQNKLHQTPHARVYRGILCSPAASPSPPPTHDFESVPQARVEHMTPTSVAIKCIPYDDPTQYHNVRNEVTITRRLLRSSVKIGLPTLVWDEDQQQEWWLALPLAQSSMLAFLQHRKRSAPQSTTALKRIDEQLIRSWLFQAAHALAFLHDHGVIHGDVKPANFVVDSSEDDHTPTRIQLIDFGHSMDMQEPYADAWYCPYISKPESSAKPHTWNHAQGDTKIQSSSSPSQSTCPVHTRLGQRCLWHIPTDRLVTPSYRAPELYLSASCINTAIDMWSLGCVLAEWLHPRHHVLFSRNMAYSPLHDFAQQANATMDEKRQYACQVSQLSTEEIDIVHAIWNIVPTPETSLPLWDASVVQSLRLCYTPRPIAIFGTTPTPSSSVSNDTLLFPRLHVTIVYLTLNANAAELDILRRLLCVDPEHRMTARELLQHPYLRRDTTADTIA